MTTTADHDPAAPPSGGAHHTTRIALVAIAGGIAVLALGMLVVRDGAVPDAEETGFRAVNDLPGWLYPVVWPIQQLGAIALAPIVAVVALVARRWRLAVAAITVAVLKLLSERGVKAIVTRERPATSIGPDIEARGDVSLSGESFVSGHAILVAALAGVVTPALPRRWRPVPWLLVAAVMFGRVYVGAHNPLDVVCGAALGIALAGVVTLILRQSVGRRGPRANRLAAAALVTGTMACSEPREQSQSALTDDAITVGSFDFTESVVVAEAYSQALEAAGLPVERRFRLGPRELVAPAMAAGLVELVPEYTGTAAEFHTFGDAEPTGNVATAREALARALRGTPMLALTPAPAQDANAFVVTQETAQRLGLVEISDLADVAGGLTIGAPTGCDLRPLCLKGLRDVYGVEFDQFVALDSGGALTRQALVEGHVDVALLFTTDPAITDLGLVELVDDEGLQPAENLTPVLRTEVVERWGDEVVAALDAVSARLTTGAVRELNRAAAPPDANVAAVVAAWMSEVSP